jgi:hypothetical protein
VAKAENSFVLPFDAGIGPQAQLDQLLAFDDVRSIEAKSLLR